MTIKSMKAHLAKIDARIKELEAQRKALSSMTADGTGDNVRLAFKVRDLRLMYLQAYGSLAALIWAQGVIDKMEKDIKC